MEWFSSVLARRQFLKGAAAGMAGLALSRDILGAQQAAPAGQPSLPVLKVGVVGCGGRGMGAARDALDADPGVKVWAMADVFMEPITRGIGVLSQQYGDRVDVPVERRFVGLQSYEELLKCGVDVVLLCSPPCFRPEHLRACVLAEKHVFAEKPLAVDVPGVKSVMETARLAAGKQLAIFTGFCWRFDNGCREAYQQVAAGKLGRVINFYGVYYTVPPKPPLMLDSRPPGISDVDWQIRNWTAYEWLCGGPLVEQAVHTIDAMCWSLKEETPIAVIGNGGRSQRRDQGNVWDHYDVVYEFPGRVFAHVSCRQWTNCYCEVRDRVFCEKGILTGPLTPRIDGDQRWKFRGEANNMYRETHKEMFAALRKQQFPQDLDAGARKTLIAIMGREAAQTGKRVTWEDIQQNNRSLMPADLTWNSKLPEWQVPVPGQG